MTQIPVHFRADPDLHATPDLSGSRRGALPDAPLAMPAQKLESAGAGWLDWLTAPLRLLRLPLSRGV